jgi:hypothetical protein
LKKAGEEMEDEDKEKLCPMTSAIKSSTPTTQTHYESGNGAMKNKSR